MAENKLKFQPIPKRFMVWLIQDKCWASWYDRHIPSFMSISQLAEFLQDWNATKEIGEEDGDGLVICQSTNLFDKDGKEIFEGSIIRDNSYIVGGRPLVAVIVVHDSIAGFTLSKSPNRPSNVMLSKSASYEVIGHVLSNPELLEEKV